MKEITEISGKAIEQYFRQDIHPEEFLNRLHRIMVSHVCASAHPGAQTDPCAIASDIDFLESIYRTVQKSMRKRYIK